MELIGCEEIKRGWKFLRSNLSKQRDYTGLMNTFLCFNDVLKNF